MLRRCVVVVVIAGATAAGSALAQQNHIDIVAPVAPELAAYVNANHNAGAPIPAPAETYAYSEALKSFPFAHYADAVWDTTRMNNILDHFATAYFDVYLKDDPEKKAYLDLPPAAPWKGFKPRTAVGLTLEHARPAQASR